MRKKERQRDRERNFGERERERERDKCVRVCVKRVREEQRRKGKRAFSRRSVFTRY